MFSSIYKVNLLFEAKSSDIHSSQVAVRVCSNIEWDEGQKPVIGNLVEKEYRDMVTKYLLFFGTWAPEMLEQHDKEQHWD